MTFVGDTTRWERPVSITVPKDPELAALLSGAGTPNEKYVGAVAAGADPTSGTSNVITMPATPQARGRMGVADAVAQDLAEILNRTPAGTPGRDALIFVAGQLGIREATPEPGPAPEPAPEPPAAPEPAPADTGDATLT